MNGFYRALPILVFLYIVCNKELAIPAWVKKTAGWWSSGRVRGQDFVKVILVVDANSGAAINSIGL